MATKHCNIVSDTLIKIISNRYHESHLEGDDLRQNWNPSYGNNTNYIRTRRTKIMIIIDVHFMRYNGTSFASSY